MNVENSIERYRGKTVGELLSGIKVGKKSSESLTQAEQRLDDQSRDDGLIFNLVQSYLSGQSLSKLATQEGIISSRLLGKLFKELDIPIRTQSEAVKAMLGERWKDEDFKKKNAEGVKTMLGERWKDEGFREKQSEAVKAMLGERWKDEDFRKRQAEGVRRARLDPENLARYKLPTIYGGRWDIGFAQSSWEANLSRVLKIVGREFLTHESLRLNDGSIFQIDFLTLDKIGRMIGYEIMSPLEDETCWEKMEKVILEYPNILFKIVDQRFYRRLERRFSKKINQDSDFAGWEGKKDNLKTNPSKYQYNPVKTEVSTV